jgi:hypothetical protein
MGDTHPTKLWEEIVVRKRAIREAAVEKYLPSKWKNGQPPWPSASERAITGIAELAQLQEKIQSGELTAEVVIRAYIRRCVFPTITILIAS